MGNKVAAILLSSILAASLFVGGCNPGGPSSNQTVVTEGVNVGNRAVDFQVQTLNGTTVKLSDYRGKPVLLNFWATWCGPCRFEVPFLDQINTSYSSKGLVMLPVDVGENSTAITNFMVSVNVTLPALMDSNASVSKIYGLTGIPTTLLIDKDGVIRFKQIGAFADKASIESALTKIMP